MKGKKQITTSAESLATINDIEEAAKQIKSSFSDRLLPWFAENQRQMQWRDLGRQGNAYAVWVSEIMLQQTRVATVVDYFQRWMEKFPTVEALAKADIEDVNQLWSGLGYYRRAKFLHEGAREVCSKFGGTIPSSYEELRKLKGIGDYTASAIASIVFKQPTAVVDGNVIRVLSRVLVVGDTVLPSLRKPEGVKSRQMKLSAFTAKGEESAGMTKPTRSQRTRSQSSKSAKADESARPILRVANVQKALKHFKAAAQILIDAEGEPGEYNQAVMELGATVCTPKSPNCVDCPVQEICGAYHLERSGRLSSVTELPPKAEKIAQQEQQVHVVIAENAEGRFLLSKRPEEGLLGGLWEFPNCQACATVATTDASDVVDSNDNEDVGASNRVNSVISNVLSEKLSGFYEFQTTDCSVEVAKSKFNFSHIVMHSDIHFVRVDVQKKISCSLSEEETVNTASATDTSQSIVWKSREELETFGLPTAMRNIWTAFCAFRENNDGGRVSSTKKQKRKITVEMELDDDGSSVVRQAEFSNKTKQRSSRGKMSSKSQRTIETLFGRKSNDK